MVGKQREEHGDGSGIIEAEDCFFSLFLCGAECREVVRAEARRAANVSPVALLGFSWQIDCFFLALLGKKLILL